MMHMYILQSLQINYRNIIVKAEKLLFKVPRFYFEKKKVPEVHIVFPVTPYAIAKIGRSAILGVISAYLSAVPSIAYWI